MCSFSLRHFIVGQQSILDGIRKDITLGGGVSAHWWPDRYVMLKPKPFYRAVNMTQSNCRLSIGVEGMRVCCGDWVYIL